MSKTKLGRTRSDSVDSREVRISRQASSVRRALRTETSPHQLPLPGTDFAPGCVATPQIGRYHSYHGREHPYTQCLTRTQWKALFGKNPPPVSRAQWVLANKRLGCGVFACAFARDARTVVKITNDQSDIEALKIANSRGISGVPKLHRAYRLKSPPTAFGKPSQRPVFGMVVERVRTVASHPDIENAALQVFCVREAAENYDDPTLCCDDTTGKTRKLCNRLAEDIPPILDDLQSLGISTGDVHPGNIGIGTNGRWKVIDLGFSGLPLAKRAAPTLLGRASRRRHVRRA